MKEELKPFELNSDRLIAIRKQVHCYESTSLANDDVVELLCMIRKAQEAITARNIPTSPPGQMTADKANDIITRCLEQLRHVENMLRSHHTRRKGILAIAAGINQTLRVADADIRAYEIDPASLKSASNERKVT